MTDDERRAIAEILCRKLEAAYKALLYSEGCCGCPSRSGDEAIRAALRDASEWAAKKGAR